jgi:hypothetical protein
VHKFVRFLTLPNNLFFTQIIKSIMYPPPLFTTASFGQVFDPTLEEIRRFGREKVVEPILEQSVVVEGNSAQTVGERAEEVVIRWGKVRRVGRMCVVGRCRAEESRHVVDLGVFAGLFPPDGEVVDNSVQQWRSGSSQAVHNV